MYLKLLQTLTTLLGEWNTLLQGCSQLSCYMPVAFVIIAMNFDYTQQHCMDSRYEEQSLSCACEKEAFCMAVADKERSLNRDRCTAIADCWRPFYNAIMNTASIP